MQRRYCAIAKEPKQLVASINSSQSRGNWRSRTYPYVRICPYQLWSMCSAVANNGSHITHSKQARAAYEITNEDKKFGFVPSHLFEIQSNATKNKMDAHPGRVIAYRNCFVRINGRKGSVRGRHAQSSNLHQRACLRDDSICFKRARPLPSTKGAPRGRVAEAVQSSIFQLCYK